MKMSATTSLRLPGNASVYELVRARNGSVARLNAIGLSRDDLELNLRDAARQSGVPVERIAQALAETR
jgi:hypothetical protein